MMGHQQSTPKPPKCNIYLLLFITLSDKPNTSTSVTNLHRRSHSTIKTFKDDYYFQIPSTYKNIPLGCLASWRQCGGSRCSVPALLTHLLSSWAPPCARGPRLTPPRPTAAVCTFSFFAVFCQGGVGLFLFLQPLTASCKAVLESVWGFMALVCFGIKIADGYCRFSENNQVGRFIVFWW